MSIIKYFFEKHIYRCKGESKDFENNKFNEVREDLKLETRKCIEEINNFLSGIDAESYTDFNSFNNKIETFNEELNRIMKASKNNFDAYIDFISSF